MDSLMDGNCSLVFDCYVQHCHIDHWNHNRLQPPHYVAVSLSHVLLKAAKSASAASFINSLPFSSLPVYIIINNRTY